MEYTPCSEAHFLMDNEKTADTTAETPVADETVNEDDQTVEGEESESSTDNEQDDEKKEDQTDEYEQELKRLKDELDEKNRQVSIKDRALQAEKKKNKSQDPAPSFDAETIKAEIKAELKAEQTLRSMAGSDSEYELAMHHYQNSIVRSGDMVKDSRHAIALANANRIQELLDRDHLVEEGQARGISSMSGASRGDGASSKAKSQLRREVEELVKGINPKAVKHVGKYVSR